MLYLKLVFLKARNRAELTFSGSVGTVIWSLSFSSLLTIGQCLMFSLNFFFVEAQILDSPYSL